MARPRAATDEQIIAAAEEIAEEKGWRTVYAKSVHERLNLGGSLSTFTKVISKWRAEKEATEETSKQPEGEIVEVRATIIDDALAGVANSLKSMREVVTSEIDRAVADERRKSDAMRANEGDLHQSKINELNGIIQTITSENDSLATEAQEESHRAEAAEGALAEAKQVIITQRQIADDLCQKAKILEEKVSELETNEGKLRDELSDLNIKIGKSEKREAIANEKNTQLEKVRSEQSEDLRQLREELKAAYETVSTAKEKLTVTQSEKDVLQTEYKNTLNENKGLKSRISTLEKEVTDEKIRADKAWAKIPTLEKEVTDERTRADKAWANVAPLLEKVNITSPKDPTDESLAD